MLLAGCMLVAFSMPLVLSCSLIFRRPQLLVISIIAAFVWLIAFSLSAVLWSLFTGVHDNEYSWLSIVLTVICQEIARLMFIRAYFYTAQSFAAASLNSLMFPLTDCWAALAAGLGFAIAQTSVVYAPIFMWAGEHGAMFVPTCQDMSVFTQSAATAACCGLIQLPSFIVAMDAMRSRKLVFLSAAYVVNLLAGILVSQTRKSNKQIIFKLPIIHPSDLSSQPINYQSFTIATRKSIIQFVKSQTVQTCQITNFISIRIRLASRQ